MNLPAPRKRFGQNFLRDPGIIERILAACDPRPEHTWLEIGPGQGALTRALLAKVGRLHAVEIDRDLAAHLHATLGQQGLTVHLADALRFDFAAIAPEGAQLRIVGNLPYNISTPLLFHALEFLPRIADMVFMLQKEVVDRLVATPGSKIYGRLSVMAQARCAIHRLLHVPAAAFYPVPAVESSVVRLQPHAQPLYPLVDNAVFTALVAQAFTQRRKTLRNALRGRVEEADFAACAIDPVARPETLSVAQFAALAHTVRRQEANA